MTRENLSSLLRYAAVALAFYALGGGKGCDVTPWVPTPPVPPTPVVVPGPRQLIVFYQQETATTPWTDTVTDLQSSKYFAEHSHPAPLIVDLDSKDSKGQPSPVVTKWQSEITGIPPPIVLVVDAATKKLVLKESVPPDAKADAVLAVLKKGGG